MKLSSQLFRPETNPELVLDDLFEAHIGFHENAVQFVSCVVVLGCILVLGLADNALVDILREVDALSADHFGAALGEKWLVVVLLGDCRGTPLAEHCLEDLL